MSHTKTRITQIIGQKFRSFGGGQTSFNNPISAALKDKPLQFAAGVDIESVVAAVLEESGHDDLLAACKNLVRGQLQHPTFEGYVKHAVWVAEAAIAKATERKD